MNDFKKWFNEKKGILFWAILLLLVIISELIKEKSIKKVLPDIVPMETVSDKIELGE